MNRPVQDLCHRYVFRYAVYRLAARNGPVSVDSICERVLIPYVIPLGIREIGSR